MSVTLDQLLGLYAAGQQLDLRLHAHERYNATQHAKGEERYYSDERMRGFGDAYWTVQHLIGETLSLATPEVRGEYKRRTSRK